MVDQVFLVIGAGSIGKRHAGNLTALGARAKLIPYRDFDAETLAQRRDVAGIVIATATPIRMELVQLCAAQGWPFYVEKPLGWTQTQIAALYDVADPVAQRSMVGFMMRYHPAMAALRQRDLSGIYSFHLEIGHDVRQWRQNWSFADSYASQPGGGGVLLDLCHELDMAHCLFPQVVVQRADSLDHADFPQVDFSTQVTLAAPDGPVGAVRMDYLSPVSLRRTALRGTDQSIDVNWLHPHIVTHDGAQADMQEFTFDRNDMFLAAMRDFIALATGGTPSNNPLLPRFDKVRASCDLIARAWEARQFNGHVAVDFS